MDNSVVSAFTLALLAFLALVNATNLLRDRKTKKNVARSSIRASQDRYAHLIGLGSLVLWIETLVLPVLTLSGTSAWLNSPPIRLTFQFDRTV